MPVSVALAFHAKAFSSKALSFMPIGPEINTKILETFSVFYRDLEGKEEFGQDAETQKKIDSFGQFYPRLKEAFETAKALES